MRVYPLYGMTAESLFGLLRDTLRSVPRASREQVVFFMCDWALQRYAQVS